MPTGTMEQLENSHSVRSRSVRRSCSPSFQPGHTTICPFITMPALQNFCISSSDRSAFLLPSMVQCSFGSVACTDTLMGLMCRSMIRCASRSVRFVSVV